MGLSSNFTMWPRPERDGSTISASGGQGSGVGGVSDLQTWGRTPGPDMISTTKTPPSQRAEFSPLWSKASPKRSTGRGTTRISRVHCDQPKRGCASRVPVPRAAAARRTGGVLVVGATPGFSPLMRHERGQGRTGLRTPFPPRSGVAPTPVIPGGKAIERLFALMVDACVSV